MRRGRTARLLLAGAWSILLPLALRGQVAPGGAPAPDTALLDTLAVVRASEDALSEARSAQTRFERARRQWSPLRRHGWLGTECDERVGRICLRYDEGGDWWPEPEDPRIVGARLELLRTLEQAAGARPEDPWIRSQRVLYLTEAGFRREAEAVARSCLTLDAAGCGTLLGFALHGQGRFPEAETAFRAALEAMPEEELRRWTNPEWILDRGAAGYLNSLGGMSSPLREPGIERLWRLADPLYLAPGNDRLTEHWSRITVARLREGTTNPYGLQWGRDLEEVLVRYGWEVGWDRVLDPVGIPAGGVVGHHHPESRSYLPPGTVLADPALAPPDGWPLSPRTPREGYAPPYAPVILPHAGELLRFPRGDRTVWIATFALPDDTTHHATHGHPQLLPPEGGAGGGPQAGLFLVPLGSGAVLEARADTTEGALLLEAPAGDYLASTEVWLPQRGFAGRTRQGARAPLVPPRTLTLSDLALLDRPLADPARLEDALPALRSPGPVRAAETLHVGWEVHGLGWQPELLAYRLSLARTRPGLVRRVGEWLGLAQREEPLRLTWEEEGPERPGPHFRWLALQVPDAPDGEYLLRLEARAGGDRVAASERVLRIGRP